MVLGYGYKHRGFWWMVLGSLGEDGNTLSILRIDPLIILASRDLFGVLSRICFWICIVFIQSESMQH